MTARPMHGGGGGHLERPSPSSLAEVMTVVLDKGLVIDAYARVSVIGIELLTVDARLVVASVDTYLRFAEATNRLDLYEHGGRDISDLTGGVEATVEKGAHAVTKHAVTGAVDKVKEKIDEKVGDVERKLKDVAGVGDHHDE